MSNTSTLINAGTNITGSSYDISVKDQRNYSRTDGAIDVGSFEYNGIVDDVSSPSIAYTPFTNTLLTTDRSITASITDNNGVYWYPQTADYRPRIYFKKNAGAWFSAVGTQQTGNGINGTWSFTISSAAMGSLANGDIVSYYIIAQDVSSIANLISAPAGVVAAVVNSISTAPTPASYIIGSTLPVKLKSFTARAAGNSALLEWQVNEQINEQINVAYYAIEKSGSGSSWSNITTLPVINASRYTATDLALTTGTYYYCLKIMDTDGKISYSDSKSVRISSQQADFSILANRVSNGILQVQINQKTFLSLYESNGKILWAKQLQPGLQQIDVSSYPKGMYFLKSDGAAQKIQIQ